MEQLIDAAEGRNFMMHARIAMLRALNHGKPDPAPAPQAREILQDRAMNFLTLSIVKAVSSINCPSIHVRKQPALCLG